VSNLAKGIIVAVVLLFAWRDRIDGLVHPRDVPAVAVTVPDADAKAWTSGIKADGVLPVDRSYYGGFFDALDWVIGNDGEHDAPIIDTNEKLRRFIAGSLDAAIEKQMVGKYPGLGESLDRAFALAASNVDVSTLTSPEAIEKAVSEGLAPKPMTKALRERMRKCARAICWKMTIKGE
jgi:hypothetical protein